MWVKVCGVTNPEDAWACVAAGVDAVGVNLFAGPRRIDLQRAGEVVAALAGRADGVALVGSEAGIIDPGILAFLGDHAIRFVQVYGGLGAETKEGLARASVGLIKPLSVETEDYASRAVWGTVEGGSRPWAVLLDSAGGQQAGGTGRTFCWEWIRRSREQGSLRGWPQIILAGGLTPDNVLEAIGVAGPFGVDVSSGVESAVGVKDHRKVRRFVEAARSVGD